jgi:WXG100 family type VII secretion target
MTYDVETARMARARDDVVAIHGELSKDYTTLSSSVEALLASGWRGKARDSYAEGWADWLEGAGAVLAGLEEMGTLLGVTRATYVQNDDTTAAQMAAAAQRVRTRLT